MEEIQLSRFILEDTKGTRSTVLIEENIRSGSRGKNELARIVQPGYKVRAVGLSHLYGGEAVLRIRDCDEVWLIWSPPEPEETTVPVTEPEETTAPVTEPAETTTPETEPETTTVPETLPPETEATEPETTTPATTAPEATAPPADPDNPPTGDAGILGYSMLLFVSLWGMTTLKKRR